MKVEKSESTIKPTVVTDDDGTAIVAADHRGVFICGDGEFQKPGFPSHEDMDDVAPYLVQVGDAMLIRDALVALGRELGWPESPDYADVSK